MRTRTIVGAVMTSILAVAGCSSEGGTTSTGTGGGDAGGAGGGGGGGGACVVPSAKISLGLLEGTVCNGSYPDTSAAAATVDGAFEPVAGGFHVVGATATVEILAIEPAIPTGTLVHLTYACRPGHYGDAGAFILLENLATLGDKPNPTENGSRLWFFAAAGGEVPVPKELPFALETKAVCMAGTIEQGFESPDEVKLTGGGASVTVAPGAEATFAPSSGPHAGSYHVKNVNTKGIGHPGGDATYEMNLTIARAD